VAAELVLRDYQASIIPDIHREFKNGNKAVMLYIPTGGGKTETALAMLKAAADNGKRSAMIMDRRILCEQTSERMDKYDIDHGVLMAGHWRYLTYKSIQICSSQTLEKRENLPKMTLLIIDEAHCMRKKIVEFIENTPNLFVIGLSASPFTKGLGKVFTSIVNGPTTQELVKRNLLSPLRVFIAKEIDMSGAKKVAGEWSQKETTERGIKITGDIVSEWIKKTHEIFNEPKKTIVFCSGVAHGLDLAEKFKEAGYNFVSLSYKDDDDFKRDTLKEFSRIDSSIMGVIATDILTKGFDQADVMIGISARPFTKSFSSHVQQLGRIMRPHEEKESAIWLDHSGNYLRFKDDWDDLYENGVSSLDNAEEKAKKEPDEEAKEAAKCPKCGELWGPDEACQHCGYIRVRRNEVVAVAGELEEIRIGNSKVKAAENPYDLYAMCCSYAREHSAPDKQKGRAFYIYKDITGENPPKSFDFDTTSSVEISRPVQNRIMRKNIAFSKRKK